MEIRCLYFKLLKCQSRQILAGDVCTMECLEKPPKTARQKDALENTANKQDGILENVPVSQRTTGKTQQGSETQRGRT